MMIFPDPSRKSICNAPDSLRRAEAKVQHYRIDPDHSNSFTVWQTMDSPKKPTADQYATLEKAGQLPKWPRPKR